MQPQRAQSLPRVRYAKTYRLLLVDGQQWQKAAQSNCGHWILQFGSRSCSNITYPSAAVC